MTNRGESGSAWSPRTGFTIVSILLIAAVLFSGFRVHSQVSSAPESPLTTLQGGELHGTE